MGEGITSFKDYLISHNIPDEISELKKNLDASSCETVDLCIQRMNHDPQFHGYRPNREETLVSPRNYLTEDEQKEAREFLQKLPGIRKKYKLPRYEHLPEVFMSRNGLIFLPPAVLEYMKGKDFIDGGAYIGDSALILSEYAPRKIFSFDIFDKNAKMFRKTLLKNHVPQEMFELVISGLYDRDQDGVASVAGNGGGTSLYAEGTNLCSFPLKKLDTFRSERNCRVGLIKLDIEGSEPNAIRGAVKTIQEDRPVLAIAIYHNPESFFQLKPFLESIVPNYEFQIRKLRVPGYPGLPFTHADWWLLHMYSLSEIYLLAYPRELC